VSQSLPDPPHFADGSPRTVNFRWNIPLTQPVSACHFPCVSHPRVIVRKSALSDWFPHLPSPSAPPSRPGARLRRVALHRNGTGHRGHRHERRRRWSYHSHAGCTYTLTQHHANDGIARPTGLPVITTTITFEGNNNTSPGQGSCLPHHAGRHYRRPHLKAVALQQRLGFRRRPAGNGAASSTSAP